MMDRKGIKHVSLTPKCKKEIKTNKWIKITKCYFLELFSYSFAHLHNRTSQVRQSQLQNTKHTLGIEEENGYRSIEIYIHFCNKKEFPLHVKKLQFQEKKFLSHQKNFQINFDNQRILRHVGTFCFWEIEFEKFF